MKAKRTSLCSEWWPPEPWGRRIRTPLQEDILAVLVEAHCVVQGRSGWCVGGQGKALGGVKADGPGVMLLDMEIQVLHTLAHSMPEERAKQCAPDTEALEGWVDCHVTDVNLAVGGSPERAQLEFVC